MPKLEFITNLFCSLGLTRDSRLWFWSRLVAVASLIAAGVLDIGEIGTWLGFEVSDVWARRIAGLAVAVLWLAGKYDSSPLPAGKKDEVKRWD